MEPGDSESLRWTEGRFQMKAIVYESGGVETLGISQVPDPVAGPGEVVVRVRACAMNHADVWGHKSEGPRFGGPRILGRDVAGVIEEVGEGVACWAKGDPVVVAPGVSCNVCFHCQHGQHSDCPEYGMLGAKVDGGYAELMKVSGHEPRTQSPRASAMKRRRRFPWSSSRPGGAWWKRPVSSLGSGCW